MPDDRKVTLRAKMHIEVAASKSNCSGYVLSTSALFAKALVIAKLSIAQIGVHFCKSNHTYLVLAQTEQSKSFFVHVLQMSYEMFLSLMKKKTHRLLNDLHK